MLKDTNNKKVLIYQSYYIPWRGYFDMINMADEFIIYDSMQYSKNGFYNRNQVKTPNGQQWITIPVKNVHHISQHQIIRETFVADNSWRRKHWNAICTNYAKAPYFEMYKERFEKLYLNSDEECLSDINISFFKLIVDILGIKTKLTLDTEYELVGDRNERLINLLKQANANIYISSPVAKDYMDLKLFDDAKIEVEWMDYSGYPEYTQQFLPFEPCVSIIDLIFNEGPNAYKYMKSMGDR